VAGDVTCRFRYETPKWAARSTTNTVNTAAGNADTATPLEVLHKLQASGVCLTARDKWEYKLCIGGTVSQSDRDTVYSLGALEHVYGHSSLLAAV